MIPRDIFKVKILQVFNLTGEKTRWLILEWKYSYTNRLIVKSFFIRTQQLRSNEIIHKDVFKVKRKILHFFNLIFKVSRIFLLCNIHRCKYKLRVR